MYPQYTAGMYSHCTQSTKLEYIVVVPTEKVCNRVRPRAPYTFFLYGGGGEVWEPEGNGYTGLTTTLWSLSICRGVSLARIQHLFQVACDSA